MKQPVVLAWHFTAEPLKLRDGKPFAIGKWITRKNLTMCQSGLHASIRLIDALKYSPGDYLYRVECAGTIEQGDDKLVCSRRRAIYGGDASEMLRKFARECALGVMHLWDAPVVVREYLTTGNESLRAAAWKAAWTAARAAALTAARDAARDAQSIRLEAIAEEWSATCLARKEKG